MPKFGIKSITGVIPAMVTPFDENEKLDETRLRAVIRFLIERKFEGLYITGSTGESFLMSPDERKRVVEITVDEVKGRIPIIAHIGAISTYHSIDLAQHAEKAGDYRRQGEMFPANYQCLLAHYLSEAAARILRDEIDCEPSRSIIYRSAASLAVAAEEYVEAARLAMEGASPNVSTETYYDLLRIRNEALRRKLAKEGA